MEFDATLNFAPAGELLPAARVLCSVANLTCRDGWKILKIVAILPAESSTECYLLERVNDALVDLKYGRVSGDYTVVDQFQLVIFHRSTLLKPQSGRPNCRFSAFWLSCCETISRRQR